MSTDEARELGVLGPGERFHGISDVRGDQLRDCYEAILRPVIVNAIRAYLSARTAGAGEGRVKALEWVELTDDRGDGTREPNGNWEAETTFGFYMVEMVTGDHPTVWGLTLNAEGDYIGGDHESPDHAKAAAQADYTARILSALEPTPAAVAPVHEAVWFWRWASSEEWRMLSPHTSPAGRDDFIRDMEKTAPIVVAPLYAHPPQSVPEGATGEAKRKHPPLDPDVAEAMRLPK